MTDTITVDDAAVQAAFKRPGHGRTSATPMAPKCCGGTNRAMARWRGSYGAVCADSLGANLV